VPPQTSIRVPVGTGQAFMAAYLALGDDERFNQQRFYYVRYRVQKGDTLGRIAHRYGVGLSTLRDSNGLSGSHALIRPGQVLRIPPKGHVLKVATAMEEPAKPAPTSRASVLLHHVLPGQSLSSIAHQYRTTIDVLRRLNDLDESQLVQAGATLKVPSY
jgi:membrane-bound lytic murein transglycosylase D